MKEEDHHIVGNIIFSVTPETNGYIVIYLKPLKHL